MRPIVTRLSLVPLHATHIQNRKNRIAHVKFTESPVNITIKISKKLPVASKTLLSKLFPLAILQMIISENSTITKMLVFVSIGLWIPAIVCKYFGAYDFCIGLCLNV